MKSITFALGMILILILALGMLGCGGGGGGSTGTSSGSDGTGSSSNSLVGTWILASFTSDVPPPLKLIFNADGTGQVVGSTKDPNASSTLTWTQQGNQGTVKVAADNSSGTFILNGNNLTFTSSTYKQTLIYTRA
jgi:hypothetical protein